MKFLCEHCKAKYQIADDKVAGRTVRMKCRKCGGSIEVRAAVTETSVAMKASDLAPERGSDPAPPRPSPLATGLSSRASSSSRPSAQNERALAGAFQRSVHREDEAGGVHQRELSAADEWYVAVNGVPVGPVRVGEVRRKAAMGAVTEDSLCWQEGMEEWRAVRTVTELAAVVREAASGGRTSVLPSEPRPAAAPVRPAAPARPAAPRPQAPRAGGSGGPLAPAAPAWARPAAANLPTVEPDPEADDEGVATLVGRSPLLDEPEAQHGGGTNGAANGASNDPFKTAGLSALGAAGLGAASPAATSLAPGAPFAAPAAPPAATPPAVAYGSPQVFAPVGASLPAPAAPAIVVPAAARRMNPIAIGMIVMFGGFGMVAAYFLFAPKPAATPAPVASVAPTVSAHAPPPPPADIPPPEAVAATSASAAPADSAPRVASAAPRTASVPPAGGGAKATAPAVAVTDPALRDLINGTGNGPSPTGPSGGSGGAGAQLTSDDLQAVVSQHSVAIRRTCWERNPSATPSVSVKVHLVINGAGQVTSSAATGNDAVVSHCLEQETQRWHFPRGAGGEVDVPFHFIRQ